MNRSDVSRVLKFQGDSLGNTLNQIEQALENKSLSSLLKLTKGADINKSLLQSAIDIKKTVGQINVTIHCTGNINTTKTIEIFRQRRNNTKIISGSW